MGPLNIIHIKSQQKKDEKYPCLFQIVINYCEVVRTAAQPAAVYYAPISSAASLRFDHCNMSCFLKAQTCRNLPIHFLFQSTNKRAELNKGKTHSYC